MPRATNCEQTEFESGVAYAIEEAHSRLKIVQRNQPALRDKGSEERGGRRISSYSRRYDHADSSARANERMK